MECPMGLDNGIEVSPCGDFQCGYNTEEVNCTFYVEA